MALSVCLLVWNSVYLPGLSLVYLSVSFALILEAKYDEQGANYLDVLWVFFFTEIARMTFFIMLTVQS